MTTNEIAPLLFPYTTVYDEVWDEEWSEDWRKITDMFATIDHLEDIFEGLEVSIMRDLTQQKLILDLKKYAYSLSKIIIEKFK